MRGGCSSFVNSRSLAFALLASAMIAGLLATGGAPAVAMIPDDTILLSSSSGGNVGGVVFADEDILAFDPNTSTWTMFLDGSAVGLGGADVNGFHVVDPTAADPVIWMTTQVAHNVPGLGLVDDSDIFSYDTGTGTFALELDGSSTSLTSNAEGVDSISFTSDGRLVLSSEGTASVAQTGGGTLLARDEDLFVREADGSFQLHFDGSDVGFDEDIWAMSIDTATDDLRGASFPEWSLAGTSGDIDDVFRFSGTLGDATSGSADVFFDGDTQGFGNEQIDGLHIIGSGQPPLGTAPNAIDDAPHPASEPGDLFHTDVDVTLTSPNVLVNDLLGDPIAGLETFGGGDLGGTAAVNAAGSTVALAAGGSLQVGADGSIVFTPDPGFIGSFAFSYVLSNVAGSSQADVEIQVGPRPEPADQIIYLSFTSGGNIGGVSFADEDILTFDPETDSWDLVFDGSAEGVRRADINGLHVVNPESSTPTILMSSQLSLDVPGVGQVADTDVFSFDIATGQFALVLEGSGAGLDNNSAEDIDAVGTTPDGALVLSTVGTANVPGPNGTTTVARDEDLFAIRPDGTWDLYFDGSDVGFTRDFAAVSIDPTTTEVSGASLGGFTMAGATGGPVDVFTFMGSTGDPTTGTATVTLDGEALGLSGLQIDGLHITGPQAPPVDTAPLAVSDGPVNTVEETTVSSPNLLGNDSLGSPAGTLVSFGGGSLGGTSATYPAGASATSTEGDLTVNADGSFVFTPASGFIGTFTFEYVLGNLVGTSSATVSIQVDPLPDVSNDVLYLSSASGGSVGGISFADEDIVALDIATGTWTRLFDGSVAGIAAADINGVHLLDPSNPTPTIWMSSQVALTVPGLGAVDDSDIFSYDTATSTFAMVLDGSTVGLTTNAEDIDAITLSADGRLVISTISSGTLPGPNGTTVEARDEDLAVQRADGTWELLFDGSDVGFTADMWAASIDPQTSVVTGSSLNGFTIAGVSGEQDDLFAFTGTLGESTSGTATLSFVGATDGFTNEQIDGVHRVTATPTTATDAEVSVVATSNSPFVFPGDSIIYNIDVTNAGPVPAENVVLSVTVPDGASVAAAPACVINQQIVTCDLAQLIDGVTAHVPITVTVDATTIGMLDLVASVSSPTPDPTSANNETVNETFVAIPLNEYGCQTNCQLVGFQDLDGQSNVLLENLIITNRDGACMSLVGAQNITIRNVTFQNCATRLPITSPGYDEGIIMLQDTDTITFTDSRFINNARADASNHRNNLLKLDNAPNTTITNNEIRDLWSDITAGVGSDDFGNRTIMARGSIPNLVVDNNWFFNAGRNALQISRVRDEPGIAFTNNVVEGNGPWDSQYEDMVSLYSTSGTPASPIQISNNWMRNGGPSPTGTAMILGDGDTGAGPTEYVVADNNVIVNPGHVGINLAGGEHMVVTNNIIYADADVLVSTSVGMTINNYMYAGPVCDDHLVDGNRVYFRNQTNPSGTSHLWNTNTCTNVTLTNNVFGDTTLDASVWNP